MPLGGDLPSPAPPHPAPSAPAAGRRRAPRPRTRRAARSADGLSLPRQRSPEVPRPRFLSHFNYDGENHGPPPRSVVNQLRDCVVEVLLKELDLGHPLVDEIPQHAVGLALELLEQRSP